MAEIPVTLTSQPKQTKDKTPQQVIDEFWAKFTTKAPGKATTVIPSNKYAERAARQSHKHAGTTTQASYEEAAAICKAKVAKIVKECRRVNQKYRDPHFDLELDLKWGVRDTLQSLGNREEAQNEGPEPAKPQGFNPRSVKRVMDVFEAPRFYIDGPTANDVRQGRDGDCWLLAALCTLSNKPSLIERVCVARDEQVGVYGFVFHRDGAWISEIIDDKLFLTKPDFDDSVVERVIWEDRERVDSEEQYRRAYQSGSGALYFAQCEHADETWLPLLEKAYAKAHGDYQAIEGGYTGEGIEDLTGGVTTELYTTDILDKEYFWREELMKVNDEFLFGCWTGVWGALWGERKGIIELHAYSIMRAVEMDGQRLLLLKNPWGKGEWRGPWSDGSKEWTAEWLTRLEHRFGDDGNFWISYDDLLRKYQAFDRTRLFGPDWRVTSTWTTVSVPWTLDYHDTYFAFSLAKPGPVVLVLSQLDSRYYRGLEGQYEFELNFRLHRRGQEDYVVRSIAPYRQTRSVNVELELEAGEYTVLMKINATRDLSVLPIEKVIRKYARDRRDKLVAVGMSYDLAHSKGKMIETEEEKKSRKAAEKRRQDKEREALKKEIMDARRNRYYLDVKAYNKRKEKKEKAKASQRAKKAAKAAADPDSKEQVAAAPQPPEKTSDSATEKPVPTIVPPVSPEADSGSGDYLALTSGPEKAATTKSEAQREDLSGEVDQATPTAPDVSDQTTEGAVPKPAPDAPPPAEQEDKADEASDAESEVSSVSEISDTELELKFKERADAAAPPSPPAAAAGAAEEEDEFEKNPWNAVATVGLRVYYKVAEADREKEIVKLHVVRPNPYAAKRRAGAADETGKDKGGDDEEKEGEAEKTETRSKGLDVDDSAKDATLEGNQEQRRKSILSTVPR